MPIAAPTTIGEMTPPATFEQGAGRFGLIWLSAKKGGSCRRARGEPAASYADTPWRSG
jgi:hypothetical protein